MFVVRRIFTVNHYCQLLFYFPCAAEASTFLFSFCFCFHSFLQLFFCYFHSIRFVSYFFATFFYFSLFLILTLSLSLSISVRVPVPFPYRFFFTLCNVFIDFMSVYVLFSTLFTFHNINILVWCFRHSMWHKLCPMFFNGF